MADEPTLEEVALQLDRPKVAEGMLAAYSCQHGQSNTPCLCHYATAMIVGDAMPKVMPDDWHERVGGDGGLTDKANVK